MPNYITNILKIVGDESLVEKIKFEISSTIESERDYLIDFNKILPMPEELKGTVSPMRTLTQEEYDDQEAKIASGELKDNGWGLSRGLTEEKQAEYIQKFGACDWYTWSNKTWGTKWNAMDTRECNDGSIKFLTAWNTPLNVMVALSLKYPDAQFEISFADEDFGHNVGKYTLVKGELVHEYIPKGGSQDAYDLAYEVTEDESYLASSIEGMDEADLENTWATNYIRIAYHKNVMGEYPEFVWKIMQEFAIEDENYEMAQKIKEHLEVEK